MHVHHVYAGANRKQSDKYGCWVYLCFRHHNGSNDGVHFNRELDLKIKQLTQRAWEKNKSREEFMRIFGRQYLDDSDDFEEIFQEELRKVGDKNGKRNRSDEHI